jgi:hypothetical protein
MNKDDESIQDLLDKIPDNQFATPEVILPDPPIVFPAIVPKHKFTLLFSAKAYHACGGANKAMLDTGEEVQYTCMQDEMVNGRWQDSYLWPDAVVVGGIDSYDMITEAAGHRQGRWKNN